LINAWVVSLEIAGSGLGAGAVGDLAPLIFNSEHFTVNQAKC